MVQCKPQPRGISQGKRGCSLQDKESFLVSCKRFLLFQKSPACSAAGGRHHTCFAVLEDTICCSVPLTSPISLLSGSATLLIAG